MKKRFMVYRMVSFLCGAMVFFLNPLEGVAQNPSSAIYFQAITNSPVVSIPSESVGCAWGDSDNDGFLDLFVPDFGGALLFFGNNRMGGFQPLNSISSPSTGSGLRWSSAAWGDIDNDGDLDLFVTSRGMVNQLYENLGANRFSNRTTTHLGITAGDSTGCAWGDFNNDGSIDLYVCVLNDRDRFYQNHGDGTFFLNTTAFPAFSSVSSLGCAWSDYDKDGHLDLFVTTFSLSGPAPVNQLYRNLGNGTFTRVTQGVVGTDPVRAAGSTWGDYNNDGYPDLFVATVNTSIDQLNRLYQNNGDGTFQRIESMAPALETSDSNGTSWADVNNDGWLDLYVANWISPRNSANNFLYMNQMGMGFVKLTNDPSVNLPTASDGITFGDYDSDGALDLFVSTLAGQTNQLFRNLGSSNHWLKVRCVGTQSNRSGIGAKMTLYREGEEGLKLWQYREVSGGDGFGSSGGLLGHFGLGAEETIDALEVVWPSGVRQTITNLAADQTITVIEDYPFTLNPPSGFAWPPSGYFTNKTRVVLVNLKGSSQDYHYTTDNSEPVVTSARYQGPLEISDGLVLRFQQFTEGQPVGEVFETEYFKAYGVSDPIPVAWKIQYFGVDYWKNPLVEPDEDPDRDGFTNSEEFVANTVPTDPSSQPIQLNIATVPRLTWNAVAGKVYEVQRNAFWLPDSDDWEVVSEVAVGETGLQTFLDLSADRTYFYRIKEVIALEP